MAEGAMKLQVKTGEKKGNLAPVPEWRPFEALRREVDRLFDSFGGGFWPSPFRRSAFDIEPFWRRESTWSGAPAVDIAESEKTYEITAELPGMDEKNIEVKLIDGTLTIKGETQEEKEEKKKGLLSQRTPVRVIRTFLRGTRERGRKQDRGELQEGRAHGDASEEGGGADAGKKKSK